MEINVSFVKWGVKAEWEGVIGREPECHKIQGHKETGHVSLVSFLPIFPIPGPGRQNVGNSKQGNPGT